MLNNIASFSSFSYSDAERMLKRFLSDKNLIRYQIKKSYSQFDKFLSQKIYTIEIVHG